LKVPAGSIVTLIGANGAGKSTTLRALSGLVKPAQGVIRYDGHDIARLPAHKIVSRGLCHVPEGRMVFANLTVKENLRMGAYLQKDRKWIAEQTDYVFGLFPRLKEREAQAAGTLSGGEQQMLAIGRALLSNPQFLMLDEPSLGIAPLLVKAIFERIVEINREQGLTILLVEQNANLALEVSSYAYVLETGKVLLEGPSAELRADPKVQAAYLGA
jgi:branched-chain amino acid transport system ATP-binding protein